MPPGFVSVSEWAQVLETVLRLDLPWRTLRPHLARLAPDGSVEYLSCFDYMGPGLHLPQVRGHTTVCWSLSRSSYLQRLMMNSGTCRPGARDGLRQVADIGDQTRVPFDCA